MLLNLTNTFVNELPGDPEEKNFRRQVFGSVYSLVKPIKTSAPELLHFSRGLAEEMGLGKDVLEDPSLLKTLTGNQVIDGTSPYAMAYAGHQFGHWAGQLGDGRAINLGALLQGKKSWNLQLKGAGPTPYSRSADGFAVLRSSIREHLCSEAMYHLGVPTTRSLSLALTGEKVLRDVMYDGHPEYEKGAVVCRVAPSFIRFGNFQLFAARKEHEVLRQLADYTIEHHFDIDAKGKEKYIEWFRQILDKTIDMIVHWQRVGFVHGVMNTDNMSIHGLTIDYGPYGWLDNYDPEWTPNTTDRQNRRYRFGNQAYIGAWNLLQLANAIYPLIGEAKPLENLLGSYKNKFAERYMKMMHDKMGFANQTSQSIDLINTLEELLPQTETDMTLFYRLISEKNLLGHTEENIWKYIEEVFYTPDAIPEHVHDQWIKFFAQYKTILKEDPQTPSERMTLMQSVNPRYVLRNYMAQLAIDKADKGDYSLIHDFYEMLRNPYQDQKEYNQWFAKRPDWARHKVGCSMLSCSS